MGNLPRLFINSNHYLISASFGHELFPSIPVWAWIAFITVINLAGVNFVSKFGWILFSLQAIVLLIFIIATLRLVLLGQIHPNLVAVYNPQHFNIHGVLQATGIVIVSYLGFDAIYRFKFRYCIFTNY